MAMAARHGRQQQSLVTCLATASLVLLCVGLAVIAVGVLVPAKVHRQLKQGVWESVVWTPNSPPETDARFRGTPDPADPAGPVDLFKVWLFNITNIDEVQAGGLPQLEQVGPYVHRVYHEKLDVRWDAEGRVFFKDYTHYQLDPNLTQVDLNANITTFNLPLLGVLANLHGSVSPEYRPFVDVLLQAISSYASSANMSGVFTTRSAWDLMWGYEDPLLLLLEALLPPGSLIDGPRVRLLKNTSSVAEALSQQPMTVNTGAKDPQHIWNVEADQGRQRVTSWPCDPEEVHGSDASQFQPAAFASRGGSSDGGDPIEVWISDLFQARRLVVNSTTELHGVKLLRYWLDPAQSGPNPCREEEVRGLMNITTPHAIGFSNSSNMTGPYIFVSMPMFCGADEALAADAGLTCDMQQHMTWVDVEPLTGITLRVFKRLMMSSRVGELGSVLDPAVRPNLTIPMFWAEEAVAATPELAQQFKDRLYRGMWVDQHLGKVCWICGGLLLLLGVILAVLTVELAADPDKWPGRSQGLAAFVERMLRARDSSSSTSGSIGVRIIEDESDYEGAAAGPSRVAAADMHGSGSGSEPDEEHARAVWQPLLDKRQQQQEQRQQAQQQQAEEGEGEIQHA